MPDDRERRDATLVATALMRLYKVVILTAIALGLGVLFGLVWWGREVTRLTRELATVKQATAPGGPGERSWVVQGIVRGVVPEINAVFIMHGDIPGLMSGMTMGFEAENPKLLQGLRPGDTIQFILKEQADNRILLIGLKKLGRAEGPAAGDSLAKQLRDVIAVGHVTGGPMLAIPPDYAKRLIDEGGRPIFVDLRSVEEFGRGHVPGARSLPLPELRRRSGELPRVGRVILYCACPPEEIQAGYQYLRDQGYPDLSVMEEGFPGWARRGYPVER